MIFESTGWRPLRGHWDEAKFLFGRSGERSLRRVQQVTPWRAAFCPVMRLTREGEQMEQAYALVKRRPFFANLSMFGVRYWRLSSVSEEWKETEVSCQPMSSTKKKRMLGLSAKAGEKKRVDRKARTETDFEFMRKI